MKFGGHETFHVRDGWLYKGLQLLIEDPDGFADPHVADRLGVGRNMAKSIRHWLFATNLAEEDPTAPRRKPRPMRATEFGELVWQEDTYFDQPGTWWALHTHIVNNPGFAAGWMWFFNSFAVERFDRATCLENLSRHLQMTQTRQPSPKTLQRDLNCLLSTYSRTIPPKPQDPEDGHSCPFRELGLMTHFSTSGYFQLNSASKAIDPEILGFVLSTAFPAAAQGQGTTDILLQDAVRQPGSPGRVFVLNPETLFDVVSKCDALSGPKTGISLAGHAGERSIRVPQRPAIEWMTSYYAAVGKEGRHAA
jgi:hypothetical protein